MAFEMQNMLLLFTRIMFNYFFAQAFVQIKILIFGGLGRFRCQWIKSDFTTSSFFFLLDTDNSKFNQQKDAELKNDSIELKGLLPTGNSAMLEDEDEELEYELNVQGQR